MSDLYKVLIDEFSDKEYAHAYIEEFLATRMAAQIQKLRQDRGWTQAQLAERAGMRQERISVLESGEYDRWSFKTLTALAGAFDTGLRLSFTEFSDVVRDISSFDVNLLSVESRAKDLERFGKRIGRESNSKNLTATFEDGNVIRAASQFRVSTSDNQTESNEQQDVG